MTYSFRNFMILNTVSCFSYCSRGRQVCTGEPCDEHEEKACVHGWSPWLTIKKNFAAVLDRENIKLENKVCFFICCKSNMLLLWYMLNTKGVQKVSFAILRKSELNVLKFRWTIVRNIFISQHNYPIDQDIFCTTQQAFLPRLQRTFCVNVSRNL